MIYPDTYNLVASTRISFISSLRRSMYPDDRMYISGKITALETFWHDQFWQSG